MDEKSGFLGGNAGVEFVLALGLLLSAIGLWFWYDQRALEFPDEITAVQPQPLPVAPVDTSQSPTPTQEIEAQAPEVSGAAPEDLQAEAPTQPVAPIANIAPSFDEVRRESDGLTVIAGRAAPGSTVRVLLDGKEVTRVQADQRGSFAAITQADADGQGHVLALSTEEGGIESRSAEEILLTPLAPVIALAEPDTETPATSVTAATGEDSMAAGEETPGTADAGPTDQAAVEPQTGNNEQDTSTPQTAQEAPVADLETSDTVKPTPAPAETAQASTQPEAPAAETQQVAILKSDADGIELLQPGSAPQVMSNVALDTISYSDAGDVQLSGRAQQGSVEVRVYLDNNVQKTLTVNAQGRWRGDVPDVDEGIYTLRVDEVDAEGVVTSRVETPFKRESPQVLADAAATSSGPLKAITVQKGATLWAIARDRYGDGTLYVRVFEANSSSIRDPDLIYPGQIFDLPN